MTAEPAAASRSERAWLIVAVVMAAACVAQAFGRFTWGVVLPGARDDLLGGSNTLAGFFGTLNVTAYMLGTLAVSWASSRVTLVGLVRIGLTISTTALGVAAFAPSGPVLGLALFAMGLGGAVIWIPAPAISARALPPYRAGMAVGLVGSGIGFGLVFAGQTASWLDRRSDADDTWQTVYRIEFGVAVVVLLGAFAVLRSRGDRPALAGGFGGVRALRTVRAWVSATVAYAAYGFSYILVLAFLVARLEDDAGFSSGEATAMFSVVGVAAMFGGLTLGPLSDVLGRRETLTSAFLLLSASGLLVLTGRQPWVAIAVVGVGLVFSGAPALIIAHIVDHTDADTYGPAFSAATLAFGVAQMISPQIGGTIADWLGSFTWVFVLSAALSAVGAVASSRLPARGR
ncbi:MAG TPA: MFS transporter [Ilumatobacter sp.]|nr:MFS transporter [Ilumatobacter sp.]